MGNGDMIRRNDAINAIRTACILNHVPFKSDTPEGQRTLEAIKAVREVPAASVREDVQGEWIVNTDDFTPKKRCSNGGYNKPMEAGEKIRKAPENFCPNCGARMRGEGNV